MLLWCVDYHSISHRLIMMTSLEFFCFQPLLLTGHHSHVNAMTFGKGSRPVLLCSASSDYVIVWDIEHCQRRIQEGKISMSLCGECFWVFQSPTLFFAGKVASGTVIGTLLGEITHLSFCFSDEQVAACSGTTIYVLNHKVWQIVHFISWDAISTYLILWCETNYAVFSPTIMLLFPY